ncbi:hypothetical protein [Nocardioides sp. GXZ039]|uniref:hypothetical protein n=1 Tax=Nocardioides sp. GXZ039 TaxID=3136018 RepID=UPI0030F3BAC4
MVTRVAASPDLLTWAAGSAGWDDETAHRRAPNLAAWLSGSKPTVKQLEKFAHDTHAPFGLLFLDQPPEERSPIPDMRMLRNESIRQPSTDLLGTIYLCYLCVPLRNCRRGSSLA